MKEEISPMCRHIRRL